MSRVARVCIKAVRAPLLACAARTGRPLAALAESVGLSPAQLGDPAARVPHPLVIRVWDQMAIASGDDLFGLFAAQLIGAAPFDLVDLALLHSADLAAMTDKFLRYQTLFHDGNEASRDERGDRIAMVHRLRDDLARSRHFSEFILAVWLTRARRATGQPVTPAMVTFRHAAPGTTAPYLGLFGIAPRFGAAEDALVFARATFALPIMAADPHLVRTISPQLDDELRATGSDGFLDEVRAQVRRRLADGDAIADQVAHALALSERTLQRRLRDAGTSFRAVLDACRHREALAHLGRGSATVTDVAFMLGFSNLSAFSRAFRRWTGSNPARYRAGAAA